MARTVASHPGFGLRILAARARYFVTRRFTGPLATPDGYLIESAAELISYWSFFVEREGWDDAWIRPLRESSQPEVLDIGANAGLFTHLIWVLNPNAKITVFEPLPKMATKISAWRMRTGANAVVHNMAVSNESGTATFYIASDHDTSASLKSPGASHSPITVQVTTLDERVAARDILLAKIDVEGVEPEVLAGGAGVLGRTSFLLAEAHTPEALQAIQHKLGSSWATRRVGECDYLFARNR